MDIDALAEARRRAWIFVQKGAVFGIVDLVLYSKATEVYCLKWCLEWVGQGALQELERGPRNKRRFQKLGDSAEPIAAADRPARARQLMWATMRGMKKFDVDDVWGYSNATAVDVTREDVSVYCRSLCRAGYLRLKQKDGLRPIYQLIRDTGIRAPYPRRVLAIMDPNLDRVTWVHGVNAQ